RRSGRRDERQGSGAGRSPRWDTPRGFPEGTAPSARTRLGRASSLAEWDNRIAHTTKVLLKFLAPPSTPGPCTKLKLDLRFSHERGDHQLARLGPPLRDRGGPGRALHDASGGRRRLLAAADRAPSG